MEKELSNLSGVCVRSWCMCNVHTFGVRERGVNGKGERFARIISAGLFTSHIYFTHNLIAVISQKMTLIWI